MLLQITTFTFVSFISPLLGLMLAIPFTGYICGLSGKNGFLPTKKELSTKLTKVIIFHILILLILFVIGIISLLSAVEIFIAVGLTAVLFNYIIYLNKDYILALITAILPGFFYIILKNILIFDLIKTEVEQANQLFYDSMNSVLSPEMMETAEQTIKLMQDVLIQGNPAIWMFSIIAGATIGALIFSKKSEVFKWNFARVRMPYQLQFLVALALILFILQLRIYSVNLLVICGFLYLIQGYSLLYFYILPLLAKNKILAIIILILPIFSYFILITLAFIGLIDNWINMRKFALNKGES